MTKKQFKAAEAAMLGRMQKSVHDTGHIYRVLYGALRLAKTEPKADLDVVILSALLHDIGRAEAEARRAAGQKTPSHAELGAQMAARLLPKLGWGRGTTARVCACIRTHSYKGGQKPATLEARILFDADKLDLTGAVGCGRALLWGAEIGEPWYRTGPNGLPAPGKKGEKPSLYREYTRKLSTLYTRFYTKKAKKIAKKRQKAMDAWFAALHSEIDGGYEKGARLLAAALGGPPAGGADK